MSNYEYITLMTKEEMTDFFYQFQNMIISAIYGEGIPCWSIPNKERIKAFLEENAK